ncbi:MAG: AMP-binding protein [Frankia sp.]
MLSGSERPVPRDTVVDLIRAHARSGPDDIAIVAADRTWTFADLWQRTCDLAGALSEAGVGSGDAVLHRAVAQPDTVATALAVMAVGAAAVPLEPAEPPGRVGELVQALLAGEWPANTWYCGSGPAPDGLPGVDPAGVTTGWPDPATVTDPRAVAYVIFTSGSTGARKGVAVEHGNLSNYLGWARHTLLRHGRGSAVVSSLAYDLSLTGLWPVLADGQPVYLFSGSWQFSDIFAPRPDPFALVKLTPSHLRLFGASGLRYREATAALVIGGERLDRELLERMAPRLAGVRLRNHYGPTECTIGCCTYEIALGEGLPTSSVPIGSPIWNTRTYVIDDSGRELPPGVDGELVVAGAGVARGYVGADTDARFVDEGEVGSRKGRAYRTGDIVRQTPEGNLVFVGRRDDQVKLNGVRLDYSEVIRVAQTVPGVLTAACALRPGPLAHLEIYVASSRGDDNLRDDLRRAFAHWLPRSARPRSIVVGRELVMTPNGKFDAAATAERANSSHPAKLR